jgi:galactose oxidase-like protein/Kelch motif protein
MKPERVALLFSAGVALLLAGAAGADDLPARNAGQQPTLAPAPVVSGTWSLFNSPPPPGPAPSTDRPSIRMLHSAIYDPVGDRMIVFGGERSTSLQNNETWSLSASGVWAQLSPAGALPFPRRDHTAIYDPVRQRMVIFGGAGPSFRNDTYELSFTGTPTWTQDLPAGVAPSARFAHTAIYDPVRDRMIVFGGYNGSFLNDVYQLTFSGTPTWSRIFPTGTPPAGRNAMTAIYDPVRDRLLVFGGWDGTNFRNDVWALSLSGTPAWTLVAATGTSPPARRHYAAIYDVTRDRLVISGGEGLGGFRNDTWALSLAGTPAWTAISAGGSLPSARCGHRAILDSAHDRMVVFGGYDANYLNDTYALSLAAPQTWSLLVPDQPPPPPPPQAPSARRDHVAIYDPVRDRMVIFGGWDGSFRNDTWALSLSGTPAWTQIAAAGTPPSARFAHTAIYDDANDRLIVFGGYDGAFLGDTWALTLSDPPTWSQLLPAGPGPVGRDAMTALLDPVRRRLVLFGGWDGANFLGDLWTLNLDGPPQWTHQTPGNGPAPSARRHYAAVHDPMSDEIVVSGGLDGTLTNDTWILALNHNDWMKLGGSSQQAPGERDGHRAILDPVRDRMIVFGGYGTGYMQDTWALSLSAPRRWTNLLPTGSPPASRLLYTAIYDPVRDRVLVYGGEGQGNERFGDTWALDFGSSAASSRPRATPVGDRVPAQGQAPEFALQRVRPNPWSGNDALAVSFSLPGGDPARLELFSISGQRVWVRDVGSMGAGSHDVRFDPGSRLAPGLYMLRLTSHGGTLVTKVAKLR